MTYAIDRMFEHNALEPAALMDVAYAHPPMNFTPWRNDLGVPGFSTSFNLLTTAPALRKQILRWPGARFIERLLTWKTAFIGSPMSELARVPQGVSTHSLASSFVNQQARRHRLAIIKDLPVDCSFLPEEDNRWSACLLKACQKAGYILLDGMALAYVPIDFASEEDYLQRLSKARRKNLKRKLKVREQLEITQRTAGEAYFQDPRVLDEYYAMYLSVYQRSDTQFDCLTRPFFEALLTRAVPGSVIVEYRYQGVLAAFNLCFMHNGNFIDKYVAFKYPLARDLNLYFVSWMVNLELARLAGCRYYLAGPALPELKASLGAQFARTRHAVYTRHGWLRCILRRCTDVFDTDKKWRDESGLLSTPTL